MRPDPSAVRDLIMLPVLRARALALHFDRDYWTFFVAAFCMDLGFGLFFFLFNLYLTDLGFDERAIGHIVACLTLGNVVGTLPSITAARRWGLRPLLLSAFICTPIVCAFRVFFLWQPAQLALAFASGMALCGWPICFSPTVAKLTHESNRASGFSIAFATGIGLGTVAGIAGGYLPVSLHATALHLPLVTGMRVVLLLSCGLTLLGALPIQRLTLEHHSAPAGRHVRLFHPFLLRFLPAFALWNIVTASFPVFGTIYLQKVLRFPLGRLGVVFSGSELAQFGAILLAPLFFKRIGIRRGVGIAQAGTALFLVAIAASKSASLTVCFYMLYFATQFMCEPGIYGLLMNSVAEEERTTASALQNLCGALCQAGAAALTGVCIVRLGYLSVLLSNAAIAVIASLLFLFLARSASIPAADGHAESAGGTAAFSHCAKLQMEQVVE